MSPSIGRRVVHPALLWASAFMLVFVLASFLARNITPAVRGTPQPPLRTVALDIAGHRITAEVAQTEEQRTRGLMFRPSLAADAGMLLRYPDAAPRNVWMQGMQFPVDVLFIRGNEVVDYEDRVPPPSATHGEAATITTLEESDAVLLISAGLLESWNVGIHSPVHAAE